ncbi:MAG: hypothetical protein ACYCQI_07405 [Gammaproteobacteria bacterium]
MSYSQMYPEKKSDPKPQLSISDLAKELHMEMMRDALGLILRETSQAVRQINALKAHRPTDETNSAMKAHEAIGRLQDASACIKKLLMLKRIQ